MGMAGLRCEPSSQTPEPSLLTQPDTILDQQRWVRGLETRGGQS